MGKKKLPSASVELDESSLCARIDDSCREVREIFEGLTAEERNALAADAWTIGLRAVALAHCGARAANKVRKPTRLSTIPPSSW